MQAACHPGAPPHWRHLRISGANVAAPQFIGQLGDFPIDSSQRNSQPCGWEVIASESEKEEKHHPISWSAAHSTQHGMHLYIYIDMFYIYINTTSYKSYIIYIYIYVYIIDEKSDHEPAVFSWGAVGITLRYALYFVWSSDFFSGKFPANSDPSTRWGNPWGTSSRDAGGAPGYCLSRK